MPAWLEDLVEEVEVRGTRFRKLMDCTRCIMPTVDQVSCVSLIQPSFNPPDGLHALHHAHGRQATGEVFKD